MKKWFCLILSTVMLMSLAACGSSKEVAVPDDTVYKQDIQEYITEMIDATASIKIFEKTSGEVADNTLTVTCVAMYSGTDGEIQGTFILIYRSATANRRAEKQAGF